MFFFFFRRARGVEREEREKKTLDMDELDALLDLEGAAFNDDDDFEQDHYVASTRAAGGGRKGKDGMETTMMSTATFD